MQLFENSAIDLPPSKTHDEQMKTTETIQHHSITGRTITGQYHRVIYPFLALLSLACLPAHFFSCSRIAAPVYERNLEERKGVTEVRISGDAANGKYRKKGYDVLVYNNDRFGRLDSYMHFDSTLDALSVSSGQGKKKIVVICNAPDGFIKWENVLSLKQLSGLCCRLEDESEDFPMMVGTGDTDAGESCEITLRPLMAKVCLKELSCDFRGTAYAWEELSNIRVYLTNVNAECSITGDSDAGERFINNGGREDGDIRKFRSPSIVCREIENHVGADPESLDARLYCYPNRAVEESFGRPFTKIVIEGKIRGKTWFWPININTLKDNGICSNDCYSLKVRLRRTGTEDPDMAIELENNEIAMEIEKWDEKENYTVAF